MNIERIYRAGNSFGAVFTNENGVRCSSFFRRNELMGMFVHSRFASRNKNRRSMRVYLQDHLGKRGGLKTVAYIDLRNDVVVSYLPHDTVREMVDTFGIGHQVCR